MDLAGRPSTIKLKCKGRYEEARASGVVSPGDLIELAADNTVRRHSTAGGFGERLIAVENNLALRGLGIDSDYAIGDLVSYICCWGGDEMLGWLADGENVTPDDLLVSDGLGSFKKAVLTEKQMFAAPRESLDLTPAPNVTRQRLKVRMI